MSEFLDAWIHHWGWLWMLIGLAGFIVIVTITDN